MNTQNNNLTQPSIDEPFDRLVDVGLMELGPTPDNGPTMVVVNRHMRDILKAKGYSVHYREFNGGHEYLNWRGTFADALVTLIGTRSSDKQK